MSTRALLVEDDPSVRESTALLLERSAIDVIAAETGEAALREFATRAPFDVVIVDLMLPGISGFDVCRRMRDRSTVPIVMLTARSDVADVVAGLELGADDYIVKPFDDAELLARVRAVIRRMKFDPRVPP